MKFNHKKYTLSVNSYSNIHSWDIIGALAGISFNVSIPRDGKYMPSCGLEFHYFNPPHCMEEYAPSHINCPVVGGKCWHDGTSLYAHETLWPKVKMYLEKGEHDSIFRMLEIEYENKFEVEGM